MDDVMTSGMWDSGFQFIMWTMMCGLSFHACIHFFLLPAATKLWSFWG